MSEKTTLCKFPFWERGYAYSPNRLKLNKCPIGVALSLLQSITYTADVVLVHSSLWSSLLWAFPALHSSPGREYRK